MNSNPSCLILFSLLNLIFLGASYNLYNVNQNGAVYTHLLTDEQGNGFLIDLGYIEADVDTVFAQMNEDGVTMENTMFFATHFHPDHLGLEGALARWSELAQENTGENFQFYVSSGIVEAVNGMIEQAGITGVTVLSLEGNTYEFDGVEFEFREYLNNEAPSQTIVVDHENKAVWTGDLVYADSHLFFGDVNFTNWLAVTQELVSGNPLNISDYKVYPGHGAQGMMGSQALSLQLVYLREFYRISCEVPFWNAGNMTATLVAAFNRTYNDFFIGLSFTEYENKELNDYRDTKCPQRENLPRAKIYKYFGDPTCSNSSALIQMIDFQPDQCVPQVATPLRDAGRVRFLRCNSDGTAIESGNCQVGDNYCTDTCTLQNIPLNLCSGRANADYDGQIIYESWRCETGPLPTLSNEDFSVLTYWKDDKCTVPFEREYIPSTNQIEGKCIKNGLSDQRYTYQCQSDENLMISSDYRPEAYCTEDIETLPQYTYNGNSTCLPVSENSGYSSSVYITSSCNTPEVTKSNGLTVTRINDGDLYVYATGSYNGMFLVTPEGVVVVDAPTEVLATTGRTLPQIISDYTSQPIKWFIYSHHHLDHVGGVVDFPEDIEYICHKKAKNRIRKNDFPECTIQVGNSGMDLEIDDEHFIRIDYYGLIHSPGNLFVYVPFYKTLMVVDFVNPGWGPYFLMGVTGSMTKYEKGLKKILKYDFDYFVGGHYYQIGSREDIVTYQEFYSDIVESIQMGFGAVNYAAIAQELGLSDKNIHTVTAAYFDQVTGFCVDRMMNELKWGDRLIDLSATIETNCFIVQFKVAIDY